MAHNDGVGQGFAGKALTRRARAILFAASVSTTTISACVSSGPWWPTWFGSVGMVVVPFGRFLASAMPQADPCPRQEPYLCALMSVRAVPIGSRLACLMYPPAVATTYENTEATRAYRFCRELGLFEGGRQPLMLSAMIQATSGLIYNLVPVECDVDMFPMSVGARPVTWMVSRVDPVAAVLIGNDCKVPEQ